MLILLSSIFAKFLGFKPRLCSEHLVLKLRLVSPMYVPEQFLQGIWQIAPVRWLKSLKSFVGGKIFAPPRPIVSFINSPLYNLSKFLLKFYHR